MIKLKMLEFAEDYINVCHIFERSLLLSNQNVSMNEMGESVSGTKLICTI